MPRGKHKNRRNRKGNPQHKNAQRALTPGLPLPVPAAAQANNSVQEPAQAPKTDEAAYPQSVPRERWYKIIETAELFIGTVGLLVAVAIACFTYIQASISRGQLDAMNRQLDAMKEQNAAFVRQNEVMVEQNGMLNGQLEALHNQQRAWIWIEELTLDQGEWKATVKNAGATPALIGAISFRTVLIDRYQNDSTEMEQAWSDTMDRAHTPLGWFGRVLRAGDSFPVIVDVAKDDGQKGTPHVICYIGYFVQGERIDPETRPFRKECPHITSSIYAVSEETGSATLVPYKFGMH